MVDAHLNPLTISKEITIEASVETVFSLLTSSLHIPQYYPYASVISEWQPGGEILFKGKIEGQEFTDYGVIEALNEPTEFCYRYWSDNHGTERVAENYLTLSYVLKPQGRGTVVELCHRNIKSQEYFLAMNAIWPVLLENLKQYAEKSE